MSFIESGQIRRTDSTYRSHIIKTPFRSYVFNLDIIPIRRPALFERPVNKQPFNRRPVQEKSSSVLRDLRMADPSFRPGTIDLNELAIIEVDIYFL